MITQLKTSRTLMRPIRASDAEEAFAWFSDPEVMRYIPFGPDVTMEDTIARIGRYMAHQEAHGFGKWVIIDPTTGRLMGDCGLYHLPDGTRVELGYRLARQWWGHGLATEVARRWLEVAGDFTTERTLHAFAHPENAVSRHVMTKLGFRYSHTEELYGMDAPLYILET